VTHRPVEGNATETDLHRARAGDGEALGRLLLAHRAALLARIRRRLPHVILRKVDPEDVLAEVHLLVVQRVREFSCDAPAAFAEWLCHVADYKIREVVRFHVNAARRSARRERPLDGEVGVPSHSDLGRDPLQLAETAELASRLCEAFDRLPESYRQVLVLARVEDADLHEVAAQLGRSYAATKRLHARALARYRRMVMEEGRSRGRS
jgi:RNA polymerase sigma factor (sigma-70 family)